MPIAARVVGDVDMRAVLAAHDMPAENRRAAALDRAHHLHLAKAHVAGIGATPSRSVVAEDVRDLQNWTGHDRRGYAGDRPWAHPSWTSTARGDPTGS